MKKERHNGKTPAGGDYSEVYYMNDKGESVEKSEATRGIIRECKKDGTLITETFFEMNREKK